MPPETVNRSFWTITLMAAALMTVTMGLRQSQGLFVSPLNTTTGLGIASISLAMAIGQFVWGAIQPIAGAAEDRTLRVDAVRVRYAGRGAREDLDALLDRLHTPDVEAALGDGVRHLRA